MTPSIDFYENRDRCSSEGSKATGGAPTGALALYGEAVKKTKAQFDWEEVEYD
ncbi:MAG: hypothetical protein UC961_04280 [Emergencia sp.]|nr:hypothetical protein [Emergencia sp.]